MSKTGDNFSDEYSSRPSSSVNIGQMTGRPLLASMSTRSMQKPDGTDFVIVDADGHVMKRKYFSRYGSRPQSATTPFSRPASGKRP